MRSTWPAAPAVAAAAALAALPAFAGAAAALAGGAATGAAPRLVAASPRHAAAPRHTATARARAVTEAGDARSESLRATLSHLLRPTALPEAGPSIGSAAALSVGASSIAFSSNGNLALVGSVESVDPTNTNITPGAAFLLAWNGSSWRSTELDEHAVGGDYQNLDDSGDRFGASVALSADGDYAVVGAPGAYGGSGFGSGAAFLYSVSVSGGTPVASLDSVIGASGASGAAVGTSVAITDTATVGANPLIAVGAPLCSFCSTPQNGFNRIEAGSVFVFEDPTLLHYSNGNIQVFTTASAVLEDTSLGAQQEELGSSVAMDAAGDLIVAGAPDYDPGGAAPKEGAVYAFSGLSESPGMVASGAAAGDQLGQSVAITPDGSEVAAGEPMASTGESPAPAGQVQLLAPASSYSATTISPSSPVAGEAYGASVGLSANGQDLVVGAPWDDYFTRTQAFYPSSSDPSPGAAFLEQASGGSFASPNEQALTPKGPNGDYFGAAVAISPAASIVAAGAPNDFNGPGYDGGNSGNTWSYSVVSGPPPVVATISPAAGVVTGGTTVTISGQGFTGATGVSFGTKPATGVQVISANAVSAVSPPGSGTVDITVTGPGGTSATTPADGYTYLPLAAPTLFASANQGNEVLPVDLADNTPANAIRVDAGPEKIAVSPDGNTAYVVSQQLDSITSINVPTGAILDDLSFAGSGHSCYGLALSPDGSQAYVTCTLPSKVLVLDLGAGGSISLSSTIAMPSTSGNEAVECLDIAVDAAGDTAYVACAGIGGPSSGVVPVDLANDTAGHVIYEPAFGQMDGIAVSPDGSTVYVGDATNHKVYPITFSLGAGDQEVTTIGSPVSVATSPVHLLLSPDGSMLYVAGTSGVVVPVALPSLTTQPAIDLPGAQLGVTSLAISPDGHTLYAANDATNGSVYPVDLTQSPPVVGAALTSGYAIVSVALAVPTAPVGPDVTGVSPSYGVPGGGTEVTITGTGFTAATDVAFGTNSADGFDVVSDTEIDATSPAGNGSVDVTVTGPGGPSATSDADQFGYLPWLRAEPAQLPADAGSNGGLALSSVACPAPGTCSAVGYYTTASLVLPMIEDEVEGSWQQAFSPQLPADAAPDGGLGTTVLDAVACSSPDNCTAVGTYRDSTGAEQGLIVQESAGVWQQGIGIVLPSGWTLNGLDAVGCAPGGQCAAAGTFYDGSGNQQGFVVDESGGAWNDATEIVPPADLDASEPEVSLPAISCAATGDCVAVGQYHPASGGQFATAGLIVEERGGTWQSGLRLVSPAGTPSYASSSLDTVSCPSAGDCQAGGSYQNGVGLVEPIAVAEVSGVWQAGIGLPPVTGPGEAASGGGATITSISCPAAGECGAVGYYDDASYRQVALMASESGGIWQQATETPLPPDARFAFDSNLSSVSCSAVGECSAAGGYLSSAGNAGLLLDETGGVWQAASGMQAPLDAEPSPDETVELTALACAAPLDCAAVGTYARAPHSTTAALHVDALGPPLVSGVLPSTVVPLAQVTVSGAGFTGATDVELSCGSCASSPVDLGSSFEVLNDGELDFVVPSADSLGISATTTFDIVVSGPTGTSATSAADQLTVDIGGPVVTSLSQDAYPTYGGASIDIRGLGFRGATAVHFGSVPAETFSEIDDSDIEAWIPPGSPGTVAVTVTTPGGTSAASAGGEFTYLTAPRIDGLSRHVISPLGGQVTLTGAGFDQVTGPDAEVVLLGYTLDPLVASYNVVNDTSMTIEVPPLPRGALSLIGVVTVIDQFGSTSGDPLSGAATLAYGASVSSLGPASGPAGGGNEVVVTGTGLGLAAEVDFGSAPAPWFEVVSDDEVAAIAPSGSPGATEVKVVTPAGTSAPAQAGDDVYTYASAPRVSGVEPGTAAPLAEVVVAGSGFTGATSVDFSGSDGDLPAAGFHVDSDTQIEAQVPEGSGTADVLVTGPGGTSSKGLSDRFLFESQTSSPLGGSAGAGSGSSSSAAGGSPGGAGAGGASGGAGAPGAGAGSPGAGAGTPSPGSAPSAPAATAAAPGLDAGPGRAPGAGIPLLERPARLVVSGSGALVVLELSCAGARACRATATLVLHVAGRRNGLVVASRRLVLAPRSHERLSWRLAAPAARRIAGSPAGSVVLDLRSGRRGSSVALGRVPAAAASGGAQAPAPKNRSRRANR